jgi:hypothetical protein
MIPDIEHGCGKVLYDLAIALVTGIIAGFVVDFLIRRREHERWLDVTNVYYLAILKILDDLLDKSVPTEFKGATKNFAVFGKRAWFRVKFKPKHSSVFEGLDPEWLFKIRELLAKVSASHPLQSEPLLLMGPLGEATMQLEALTQTYGPVGEPKLREKLGGSISRSLSFRSLDVSDTNWKSPDYADRYFIQLIIVMRSFNELREGIISKGELTDHPPDLPQN